MYNFEILDVLYTARDQSAKPKLLNKPITIQIVSIVEAVLIDFLTRLEQATNHLPAEIDMHSIQLIKNEIDKDKKPVKLDEEHGGRIYFRRKMYHFNQIVKILRKHQIFGPTNDDIYELLSHFADMRNRVHIENYHRNLEEREPRVFTNNRLEVLETLLAEIWDVMKTKYKRP